MIIAVVVFCLALLGAMYLIWRVKYRYPPLESPQVLCYHKLSSRFLFEGTWTTPERFLAQIDHLTGRDYRFIDEAAFLDQLTLLDGGPDQAPPPGEPPGPSRPLAEPATRQLLLTFDDGYEAVHSLVFPELVKRGIPALIFVVTDYVGRENRWDLSLGRPASRHLDWAQLREMAGHGFSIGSHGSSHRDFTRLSDPARQDELCRSRDTIEAEMGRPVRTFSYPFGRYDRRLREQVRAAGYEAAFSLYPKRPNDRPDRFALRRNGVYVIDSIFNLNLKLEPHPLAWFEEIKCRAINGVAALTPLLKRFSGDRDS